MSTGHLEGQWRHLFPEPSRKTRRVQESHVSGEELSEECEGNVFRPQWSPSGQGKCFSCTVSPARQTRTEMGPPGGRVKDTWGTQTEGGGVNVDHSAVAQHCGPVSVTNSTSSCDGCVVCLSVTRCWEIVLLEGMMKQHFHGLKAQIHDSRWPELRRASRVWSTSFKMDVASGKRESFSDRCLKRPSDGEGLRRWRDFLCGGLI